MQTGSKQPSLWQRIRTIVHRAGASLLLAEVVLSLLTAAMIGPLLFVVSYPLLGLAEDRVLANWDLARFLFSPLGLAAIFLAGTFFIALKWVELAVLVMIADRALHEQPIALRGLLARLARAAPSLFGVAAMQTGVAMLATLPFIGVTIGVYRGLLGGSDINFYLAERPPQFLVVAAIGVVLATAWAVLLLWWFARGAFAVPASVLGEQRTLPAMRASARLMRGRYLRTIGLVGGCLVASSVAIAGTLLLLDRFDALVLRSVGERLAVMLWTTAMLLLFDTAIIQAVAAFFAALVGAVIACEYQSAGGPRSAPGEIEESLRPAHGRRDAAYVVTLLISATSLSLAFAFNAARSFIEHRPAMVTAHRAGSALGPENSIAALRRSIEAGADYAEIDVQQTADGHVVLLHDRDLRRVTGDPRDLHLVTLAELQRLRLLDAGQDLDQGVPTLAEFIDACGDRLRLNIELKDFGHGRTLPAAVMKVLREKQFLERAVISSFEPGLLRQSNAIEPNLPTGIILSAIRGDATRLRFNFLSVRHRLITAAMIRHAHERGLQIHAWTVNNRETALRLLDLGCDNLLTSDPRLMREVVDWHAGLSDVERVLLRVRRWMRE